ncbi:hypothetical protein ABNX05_15715 [Lysinibacillus sp. M3]|uniref:Uncharacterized protein n=1 Tax=Lysinibacillus zambalensis TaxID=3160866 RepID=A0ABV1MU97_9BACI
MHCYYAKKSGKQRFVYYSQKTEIILNRDTGFDPSADLGEEILNMFCGALFGPHQRL